MPGEQGWGMTLNEIWYMPGLPSDEGRLIMLYEDRGHHDPAIHFPDTTEKWGDKDDPFELKVYLDQQTELARANDSSFRFPWRPNCQMTPTVIDVVIQK